MNNLQFGVDVDADNTQLRTIDNQVWWIEEIGKPEGRSLLVDSFEYQGMPKEQAARFADRLGTLDWRKLLFSHFVRYGMGKEEATNVVGQLPHIPPPFTDKINFSAIWGGGDSRIGNLIYHGMFKFAEGPATMDVPLIEGAREALEDLVLIPQIDPSRLRVFTAREPGEGVTYLEKRLSQEPVQINGSSIYLMPDYFRGGIKVVDRKEPKADRSRNDGQLYLIDDAILSHLGSPGIDSFRVMPAVPYRSPSGAALAPEEQLRLALLFTKLKMKITEGAHPLPVAYILEKFDIKYAPGGIREAVELIRKDAPSRAAYN